MNYNKQRHRLLEILSTQNINVNLRKDGYNVLGVSFEEIFKKLNVDEFELKKITSELYDNKEIGYHDAHNVNGLYADHFGITAFSNRKYLKKNEDIIINWFKVFVQIVVPVLALLVAVLSLTTKLDVMKTQYDKELQKLENIMKEQKKRIEKLERNTKILPNYKTNNSL